MLRDLITRDRIGFQRLCEDHEVATLYQYGDAKQQHSWSLMTGYQQLSDRSDGPTDLGNRLINLNLQYQLRWLASRWGLVLGANYNDYSALLTTNERFGATVGGTRMLEQDKLLLRHTHTWNRSQLPDRMDDIHSTHFSMNYRLSDRHALMLSAGNIRREGLQAFTETRGTVGYRMRF